MFDSDKKREGEEECIAVLWELVIFPNTIDFMGTRNELQDFAL